MYTGSRELKLRERMLPTSSECARPAAAKDPLLTQRLILELLAGTFLAVQKDKEFVILTHFKDSGVDLHIRYEVRREFAPSIGVSWRQGTVAAPADRPGL